MAFHYFTIEKIRQIDIENIPDDFYDYYNNLSEEMKREIREVRPELVERLTLGTEADAKAELLEEQDSEIIDAWEDISVKAWANQSVQVPVLVCKVMPDHNNICRIHGILLRERTLKIKSGSGTYGIAGKFCPDCMDFFVEQSKINSIARALSERNIPTWIQPLEETLSEWRESGKTITIDNDTTVYIPDTWIEGNTVCPIHTEEYLIENTYRKVYKDRQVEFEACYCAKCKKIIMRNSLAQRLEEECGEIGIPPIHFERLKKEIKEKIRPLHEKRKPDYFLQNGQISLYTYEDEIDWIELSREDTVVVSYSRVCTQEHETEDVLGLVRVCEKKAGPKDYLILMGYCDECEQYYIDRDDYSLLYERGRPELLIYDDTNSDYMVTSGAVFDSEDEHLEKLESDLLASIQAIRNLPDFVAKYATNRGGYDDGGLAFSKNKSENYYKEINRLGSYLPKPYGYRTDLVEGDTTITYYLGPDDIILDNHIRVVSFNSDQGRTMVNYRTLGMSIDGKDYKVKRRRTFDIEGGKLFGYSEVSDEDAIFKSGITDRFLINVLNMRKKRHQLIDIISTIQENQNTIVDLPLKQNLIVQGCAGSGKTMVMLHRLSALKYNNPDFDFDAAVVLTPNQNFNTHIAGLAASLQLGYINRYSVEEYYEMLLQRYDASFKSQNRISDEANVDQVYVDYTYSEDFLGIVREVYEKKIKDMRGYYDEIGKLSERMGRPALNINADQACDLIKPLLNELSVMVSEIKRQKEKVQQILRTISQLNDRYEFLGRKMSEEEQQLQQVIQSQTASVYKKLQNAVKEKLEQIEHLNEEIIKHKEKYTKTGSATFVFRKSQKLAKMQEDIEKIQNKKETCQEEANRLNSFINTDIINMNQEELVGFFREMIYYIADITDNIRYIERQTENVSKYKKEREELPQLILSKQNELEIENQDALDRETEDKVSKLYIDLQKITPQSVYSDIYVASSGIADNILQEQTGKNCIPPVKGFTHRYDLYLKLHFAMWYFGKTVGGNTFISVDEGQDLSIQEYELIKQMNGEAVIFNIYGDTNQLLKSGRGISNWEVVRKILDRPRIFFLNENYRNTNQITQFCNDTFSMQVLLTGVDGHKVKEILRSRFERTLAKLKINEERIAIILPRCVKKEEYIDLEQLPRTIRAIIGEEIGNGKIAVVYVDEVKGVEFDRVFVVPDGMNKNEQYIAYTRALADLIIVKDESIRLEREIDKIETREKIAPEFKETGSASNDEARFDNIRYGKVKRKRAQKESSEISVELLL